MSTLFETSETLVRRSCSDQITYNGRLGLRISSIPVVLVTSFIGVMFPLISSRVHRLKLPPFVYFFAKYFGSGVIVGTSFVHLLFEAVMSLSNECLPLPFQQFPYAIGIALVSMFVTFWIEITTRYIIRKRNGGQDIPHTHGPSGLVEARTDEEMGVTETICNDCTCADTTCEGPDKRETIETIPEPIAETITSDENKELGTVDAKTLLKLHQTATINAKAHLSTQIATICLLEFGVVFHSIFVGLTLAVTNESFTTLYVVICFHQMFEGMGLGSRLAETQWGEKNEWISWTFAIAFSVTTPIGIAIGLGVRNTYPPGSTHALITSGVFDSISAGILIYTSLVELMGMEFLHSDEFHDASYSRIMLAFGWMCFGCGMMSLLGRWA